MLKYIRRVGSGTGTKDFSDLKDIWMSQSKKEQRHLKAGYHIFKEASTWYKNMLLCCYKMPVAMNSIMEVGLWQYFIGIFIGSYDISAADYNRLQW